MRSRWLIICERIVSHNFTHIIYIQCQFKQNLAGFSLQNKFAIDRNSSKASTTGITKEGIDI